VIYGGETPFCPGEVAKLTLSTNEKVFWGVFYATGNGSIVYVESPPPQFSNVVWSVIGRDLPGGTRETLLKDADTASEGAGPMNVNITIPDVAVTGRTLLTLQVVINGYVARPTTNNNFVYDQVEMRSVPFTLQVVPSNLRWLVHQDDWVPLSFIGGWIAVFGLIIKKKKKVSP
jgi:hypothetical protein